MLSNEYTDNLFAAIDTIIAERIRRLPYDKTAIAEIVDASEASNGKYKVSQDTNYIYNVYSDNPTYQKGDQVYVISLGSDTQRFILGMYARGDSQSRINRIFEEKEES